MKFKVGDLVRVNPVECRGVSLEHAPPDCVFRVIWAGYLTEVLPLCDGPTPFGGPWSADRFVLTDLSAEERALLELAYP